MGDKSCYMGAGGYQANTSNGSGYTKEDYAPGGSSGGSSGGGSTGGSSQPQSNPGVFKARTDQSCYLGPN